MAEIMRLTDLHNSLKTAYFMEDKDINIIKTKYKTLHHLRHDTIHYLAHYTLKRTEPLKEQKMRNAFPELMFEKGNAELTPDITFTSYSNGKVTHTIIDVTVSNSPENARRSKINKYTSALSNFKVLKTDQKESQTETATQPLRTLKEIMEEQKQEEFEVYFNVFAMCVQPDLSNLDTEIQRLVHDTKTVYFEDEKYKKIKKELIDIFEQCNKHMDLLWNVYKDVDLFKDPDRMNPEIITEWDDDLYKDVRDTYFPQVKQLEKHFIEEYSTNLENLENEFIELAEDPEVIETLKDTKQTPELFSFGFDKVNQDDLNIEKSLFPKPTFHIPCASLSVQELMNLEFLMKKNSKNPIRDFKRRNPDLPKSSEQESIIDLLNYVCHMLDVKETKKNSSIYHKEYNLLKHIRDNVLEALQSEGDLTMFCTNKFMLGEQGDKFEQEYTEFRHSLIDENRSTKLGNNNKRQLAGELDIANKKAEAQKTHIPSKRDFARKKGVDLRPEQPTIYKNKCVNISRKNIGDALLFLEESATDFKRKVNSHRVYKEAINSPVECTKDMEDYYNFLCEEVDNGYTTPAMLYCGIGVDAPSAFNLKKDMLEEFQLYLARISKLRAYQLQWHTHYCASQLLHFTEMNTQQNHLYIFNSGMPNMLHVCRGGSKDRGTDTGQAFFSVFLTFNKLDASSVFGKVNVIPVAVDYQQTVKTLYICITNWRRLSSKKLCFIKDQVYSTLSTGFDTWHRNSEVVDKEVTPGVTKKCEVYYLTGKDKSETDKHIYVFRTMVSLCTSQRVAALLMDTRYIFMSCVSDYSSIHELIIEKFSPPYPTALHRWIVNRLSKRSLQIMAYLKHYPMTVKNPVYDANRVRLQQSLGGSFRMPSLWTDITLQSVQDMFDEMFVYVHTMKEPSEIHYENVKAVQTINKFQQEFNNLSQDHKIGLHTKHSFKDYILKGGKVGCWSKYIYASAKTYAETHQSIYATDKFKRMTTEESISDIHSTKACIPEYARKTIDRKLEDKELKIFKNRMKDSYKGKGDPTLLEYERSTHLVLDQKPKYSAIYESNTNRAKVHDCMYDHLNRFPNTKTVLDVSHWNMKHNSSRVVADICIKAQYGSKREFYVLNFGAKCFVRISENIYKALCQTDSTEMISIPGEQKLEIMESMINKTILMSEKKNDHMFYVNGDCTKWSACETMASFISMSLGLTDIIGESASLYTQAVFAKWTNKKITVPTELVKNTRYITDKTEYLRKGVVLDSSQNFLQGMFNYSSSFKASLAVQFAVKMFRKKYPTVSLSAQYMVHSDDYVLLIRCSNSDDLEKFRVYHKLSQKMHGISDSTKKTNVQRVMMEFISLFSFNGQMCYPRIKKSKEVGLNISCDDFRGDAMSICSRAGEAVRLGLPLISAYILQRIHCVCLYEAYSLSDGKQNTFINENLDEVFNTPLEMLGLPDCLPLAYSASKGNPNNYRIYLYGNTAERETIINLFKLSVFLTNSNIDFEIDDYKDVCNLDEFYNPKYLGVKRRGRLALIKKGLHLNFEQAQEFFDNYPIYTINKPRNARLFKDWLASQYYTASFAKAYNKQSRPALSLKLSRYATVACMVMPKLNVSESKIEISTTICKLKYVRNIFFGLFDQVKKFVKLDDLVFMQALTCGQTNIQAFYAFMENTITIPLFDKRHMPSVSGRLPANIKWQHLNNSPSTILHYLLDNKTFQLDEKKIKSYNSMLRDKQIVEKVYDITKLQDKTNRKYLRLVFKDMASQYDLGTFGIVYTRNPHVYTEYLSSYLIHGTSDRTTYQLARTGDIVIKSPGDGHAMIAGLHRDEINPILALTHTIGVLYNFCVRAKKINYKAFAMWISGVRCSMPNPEFAGKTIKQIFESIPVKAANLLIDNPTINHAHLFLRSLILDSSECLTELTEIAKHYYKSNYELVNGIEKLVIVYKNKRYVAMGINTKMWEQRRPIDEKLTKTVLLKTPEYNIKDWMFVYIIALKEFNVIEMHTMVDLLTGRRDYTVPCLTNETEKNILKSMWKSGDSFSKRDNNILEWKDEIPEYPLPIVLSSKRQNVHTGSMEEIPLITEISIQYNNGTIKNGLSGIYRFPVSPLEYYPDILSQNKEVELYIDTIPINQLLPLAICKNLFKNLELTSIDTKENDELFKILKQLREPSRISRDDAAKITYHNQTTDAEEKYCIQPLTALVYAHAQFSTIIETAIKNDNSKIQKDKQKIYDEIKWGIETCVNRQKVEIEDLLPLDIERLMMIRECLKRLQDNTLNSKYIGVDLASNPTNWALSTELEELELAIDNDTEQLKTLTEVLFEDGYILCTKYLLGALDKLTLNKDTSYKKCLNKLAKNDELFSVKMFADDVCSRYREFEKDDDEAGMESCVNEMREFGLLDIFDYERIVDIVAPVIPEYDFDFMDFGEIEKNLFEAVKKEEVSVVNNTEVLEETKFSDKDLRDLTLDLSTELDGVELITLDDRTILEEVKSSISSEENEYEIGTSSHFIFKGFTEDNDYREKYTIRQLRLLEKSNLPQVLMRLAFGPSFIKKLRTPSENLKYLRLYWGLKTSLQNTYLEKLLGNYIKDNMTEFTHMEAGERFIDTQLSLSVEVTSGERIGFYRLKERERSMTDDVELAYAKKMTGRDSKIFSYKQKKYIATPLSVLDMTRTFSIAPGSLDTTDYPSSLSTYLNELYEPYKPQNHYDVFYSQFI